MRFPSWTLLAIAALAAAACTSTGTRTADSSMGTVATTDPAMVRMAIDSANAKFIVAMNAGDTATMKMNYADDAMTMMSGSPVWHGRDDIAKGFGAFINELHPAELGFTTHDVLVSGDLAVEAGSYQMTLTPKGGKAMQDKGNYVTVWQKQTDGSWKIVRDIAVSELPPK